MAENLKPAPFPFIGGSYESRSRTFDSQKSQNVFVEISDVGAGKGGQPAGLFSRPGLRRVQELGTGPIRGEYTIANSQLSFIVSGNEVYQLSSAEGIAIALPGNLTTSAGPVSMSDNGQHVLLVDGVNGYTIDLSAPAVTTIVDPNFYNGARTVTYQGGYFVLEVPGTSNFFISDIDSIDFPPLNESSAVTSPDVLIACISNNEQLYLLGARTFEVWALTGASASAPFSLISGRAFNMGCAAFATVRRIAGTFCWLGANDQGDGVVYSMENDSPTRISTHAIEFLLQQYGDLSTSTALAWQEDGHYFYALNLPGAETTYVYDMTSKQWHERTSSVNGVIGRWRAENHCFLNGEHLMGDFQSNAVYVSDKKYMYDNGQFIRKLRRTPHSSIDLANVFYKTLQVDIQPGAGTLTVDPRLVLRISRDGSFTFGNPIYASMGKVGQYRHRARWQRLGYARDAVFEVYCDDPCDVTFLSAYLDFERGNA